MLSRFPFLAVLWVVLLKKFDRNHVIVQKKQNKVPWLKITQRKTTRRRLKSQRNHVPKPILPHDTAKISPPVTTFYTYRRAPRHVRGFLSWGISAVQSSYSLIIMCQTDMKQPVLFWMSNIVWIWGIDKILRLTNAVQQSAALNKWPHLKPNFFRRYGLIEKTGRVILDYWPIINMDSHWSSKQLLAPLILSVITAAVFTD